MSTPRVLLFVALCFSCESSPAPQAEAPIEPPVEPVVEPVEAAPAAAASPQGDPISAAQINIERLTNACDAFFLSSSPKRMPDQLKELAAPPDAILDELPLDPWGNEFVYRLVSERQVELFSAGPDGIADNEDDVHERPDDSE